MKYSYVYILASGKHGTLYIGVTSNLIKRVFDHKQGAVRGFTKKYNVKKLVFYQQYEDILEAINREKQIKEWNRQWKIELIERSNPDWIDLYNSLI